MKNLKKFRHGSIMPIALSLLLAYVPLSHASAAISSCTASIDPTSVQPNSQSLFTFTINNDGPTAITWIQVLRPSPNYIINSAAWSGSSSTGDDQTTLYDGTDIPAGASDTLGVSVHAGLDQTGPESWAVIVSDSSDGSDPTTCTGSLDTSVAGETIPDPDTTAPVIDQIKLSQLKSNSIVISWLTDELSDSDVSFGETDSYGEARHSAAQTLDHSLILEGLSPDTSYHFMVTSYDVSGNGVSSGDNTFLTPVSDPPGSSGGGTTNPVVTPIKTTVPVKAIPTEKIPPTVKLLTDLSKPQKAVSAISGIAEDNEALAGIYYSLDGGKNWLPVDLSSGLGTKKATFSFTPANLSDGNYQLSVSAIDTSANRGSTSIQTLVIDRLPPTVGGNIISVGSQILTPNSDGVIRSLVGVDQRITLNAVGGPTSITIAMTELDKDVNLQAFSLTQSADTGLWAGTLSYSQAGLYKLVAKSVDGAGNKTSRTLGIVSVSHAGEIVNVEGKVVEAKVRVYSRDLETNSWVLWDSEAYAQPNPITTNGRGLYGLYLPAGTYYLKVEAKNYRTVVTRSFTLDKPGAVNSSFKLGKKPGFDVGPIKLRLPWSVLGDSSLDRSPSVYAIPQAAIIDTTLPQFSLLQTSGSNLDAIGLLGKPTVMTFINIWSGSAGDQMQVLDSFTEPYLNVVAVSSGVSAARVSSFAKLAGYKLPIAIDNDNQLIDKLGGSTMPATYFIDRHGIVKKVMVGVLSKEEILKNVSL